ncbi:hypothetical protein K443DRAFT_107363 [Laccaria amethystina LaAM-08-1]|uniref:Uncharacterized protein n=1 Tax=Laccaria amethystina LaAM-08-1 TaxID=1095629 RepID=A0A0C9WVB5_9AGAR|nr:hypothetical protein K443DRAFT_107363 [Laccaria amethystina LaAM-08-1]
MYKQFDLLHGETVCICFKPCDITWVQLQQKPKFTHRLQNFVSDYLFVFTYIHPHFRIILQIRNAYCKKNHVIWTRSGRAT